LRTEVERELDTQSDPVDIDVDAELQAIKDDLDDADGSDSDTGDENAPDPDES
jgi:hypothetical protein